MPAAETVYRQEFPVKGGDFAKAGAVACEIKELLKDLGLDAADGAPGGHRRLRGGDERHHVRPRGAGGPDRLPGQDPARRRRPRPGHRGRRAGHDRRLFDGHGRRCGSSASGPAWACRTSRGTPTSSPDQTRRWAGGPVASRSSSRTNGHHDARIDRNFHAIHITKDKCDRLRPLPVGLPDPGHPGRRTARPASSTSSASTAASASASAPRTPSTPTRRRSSALSAFEYKVAIPSTVLYGQFGPTRPCPTRSSPPCAGSASTRSTTSARSASSTARRPRSTSTTIPGPGRSSPRPARSSSGSSSAAIPRSAARSCPIEPPREIAAKILRTILPQVAGDTGREDRHHPHHALPGQDGLDQQPGHPGQVLPRRGHLDPGHLPPDPQGPAQERGGLPHAPSLPGDALQRPRAWAGRSPAARRAGLKRHRAVAVSGIRDTMRVLDEVEGGLLQDIDLLECTVCPDGCVGGPLGVENRFLAKSRILELVAAAGEHAVVDQKDVSRLYHKNFLSFDHPVKPTGPRPLDARPGQGHPQGQAPGEAFRRAAAEGLRGLRGARLPDPGRRHRPRLRAPRRLPVRRRRSGAGPRREEEEGEAMTLRDLVSVSISGSSRPAFPSTGPSSAVTPATSCRDVIGHGRKSDLWLTMQVHPNIVAVAVLKDLAGIVLVDGREPAPETLAQAEREKVPAPRRRPADVRAGRTGSTDWASRGVDGPPASPGRPPYPYLPLPVRRADDVAARRRPTGPGTPGSTSSPSPTTTRPRTRPPSIEAAAGTGLAVLPGIELTTAEEVHVLGLFEAGTDLGPFQAEIDRNLPDVPAKRKFVDGPGRRRRGGLRHRLRSPLPLRGDPLLRPRGRRARPPPRRPGHRLPRRPGIVQHPLPARLHPARARPRRRRGLAPHERGRRPKPPSGRSPRSPSSASRTPTGRRRSGRRRRSFSSLRPGLAEIRLALAGREGRRVFPP